MTISWISPHVSRLTGGDWKERLGAARRIHISFLLKGHRFGVTAWQSRGSGNVGGGEATVVSSISLRDGKIGSNNG